MDKKQNDLINWAMWIAGVYAALAVANAMISGDLTTAIFGWTIPGTMMAGWIVVITTIIAVSQEIIKQFK